MPWCIVVIAHFASSVGRFTGYRGVYELHSVHGSSCPPGRIQPRFSRSFLNRLLGLVDTPVTFLIFASFTGCGLLSKLLPPLNVPLYNGDFIGGKVTGNMNSDRNQL